MPNRAQRRSSTAKYPTSLDQWAHDRLIRGLELPAVGDGPDRLVDYELPNLNTFAKLGDVPQPLAAMAVKAEWDPEFNPMASGDEERKTYYDLMCWVIAWGLRKPNVLEEMGGNLANAAAWVDANIHDTQKVAIWQRAQHMIDPNDVLAALEAIQQEVKGSDLSSVADLERFRGGGQRPDVPANSGTAGRST